MTTAALIEGFWCQNSGIYHYFVLGDQSCLCGARALKEMGAADRQDRKPGREDCCKCTDIYREIHAPKPPSEPEPDWTVKQDGHFHLLLYQGAEQKRSPGNGGDLRELARIFNSNGTTPKKKSKARCAADHPQPEKFLAQKTSQSPPLPFAAPPSPPSTPTTNTKATMSKAKPQSTAEITAPTVETFPASEYRRYPTNRTPAPEAVKEMTASVRDLGLLQPIIARLIPGDPQIEILAGETRWLGCKAISADYPVPCFLRNVDDKEAAKIHAVENFQRKDLNPIEEGREIQNMLDCGWTMDEIMKHLGKEKDYLYKRRNLLELPESGKQAVLDGNLSLNTVSKLLTLPKDEWESAIQAVTEPTHSDRAMPEKEALQYLQKNFVEPLEKAAAWEERRALLEKENPGCEWLSYEHARHANSNFDRADSKPSYQYLSDAAREEELVVPTWGELAEKHGAKKYIGMAWNGDAEIFVSSDELVEAEKAAHDEKPEDCIFTHEKAVQKSRDAAEKRKIEQAAAKQQLEAERKKLITLILTPGAISKTATAKLARRLFDSITENYNDLGELFEIEFDPSSDDYEEHAKKIADAVNKAFKSKEMTTFEVVGRLVLAAEINEYSYRTNEFAIAAVETGSVKPAEFPSFAKIHSAWVAEKAAEAANNEETDA